MDVRLIAGTAFYQTEVHEKGWTDSDIGGAQALIEFAGRACYQSWHRPNAATASNRGYIEHLLEVGHLSVVEHATCTFYITGVSRSLTHEFIRHRHLSYSQLSQRYVDESAAEMIQPTAIEHAGINGVFAEAVANARRAYTTLLAELEEHYAEEPDRTKRRKMARQSARSVLPNATETKVVVTGNLRAWRHFITMRATEFADPEIRELAIRILGLLRQEYRNVFADFKISRADDGAFVASTPHPRE